MRTCSHVLLMIVMLIVAPSIYSAAEQPVLSSGSYVNKSLKFFVDDQNLDPAHVLQFSQALFIDPPGTPHSMGLIRHPVWILMEMDDATSWKTIIFENVNGTTDKIDLYHFNADKRLIAQSRAGSQYPFDDRALPYRYPTLKVEPTAGKNYFLFRFETQDPLVPALRVWQVGDFLAYAAKEYIFLGLGLGGILLMGIINLFIYASVRERIYLQYSAYIVMLFCTELNILGLSVHFDPTRDSSNWTLNAGIFFFSDLTFGLAGKFTLSFLDMKRYMPRLAKILQLSANLALLNALGYFFSDTPLQIFVTLLNGMFTCAVQLSAGIIASRHRYQPAYFFTAAWCLLLSANINLMVSFLGLKEFRGTDVKMQLIGAVIEGALLTLALGYRIKLAQKKHEEERRKKDHYYDQMEKVFHPHQLLMMQNGNILEATMPIGKAEACVIAFDIANSARLGHAEHHLFFESVMKKCQLLMNGNYDTRTLTANAFRIKQMGDGFLCSVGFPFKVPCEKSLESFACDLTGLFMDVFEKDVNAYFGEKPVFCGVGIAKGEVIGYFPTSGTREYELIGDGIVLATRYESMRKILLKDGQSANVLIIQEKVFEGLTFAEKRQFKMVDLKEANIAVRDDFHAERLYYRLFPAAHGQARDVLPSAS